MRKVLWFISGLAVFLAIAWLAGIRILVVQPIGALPDGATIILYGPRALAFVDSPDAFCMRHQGEVTLLCRGVTLGAIGKNATVLVRLPYIQPLYWLTGAPDVSG